VRDLADGGDDRAVDDQRVIVGVERELGRVERLLVRGRGEGWVWPLPAAAYGGTITAESDPGWATASSSDSPGRRTLVQ